jgi:hypothetical protein
MIRWCSWVCGHGQGLRRDNHPTHWVCQTAPAKEREETNTKENKEKGVVGGSEIKERRQTCAGVVCVVVEAAKR